MFDSINPSCVWRSVFNFGFLAAVSPAHQAGIIHPLSPTTCPLSPEDTTPPGGWATSTWSSNLTRDTRYLSSVNIVECLSQAHRQGRKCREKETTAHAFRDTCWGLPQATHMDMMNSNVGPGAEAVEHDDNSHPCDGDHRGRPEKGEANGPEPWPTRRSSAGRAGDKGDKTNLQATGF